MKPGAAVEDMSAFSALRPPVKPTGQSFSPVFMRLGVTPVFRSPALPVI
jgi:hypothetical protein